MILAMEHVIYLPVDMRTATLVVGEGMAPVQIQIAWHVVEAVRLPERFRNNVGNAVV